MKGGAIADKTLPTLHGHLQQGWYDSRKVRQHSMGICNKEDVIAEASANTAWAFAQQEEEIKCIWCPTCASRQRSMGICNSE